MKFTYYLIIFFFLIIHINCYGSGKGACSEGYYSRPEGCYVIDPPVIVYNFIQSHVIKCVGDGCIIEMYPIRNESDNKTYTNLGINNLTLNAHQSLVLTNFGAYVEIQNHSYHSLQGYLNLGENISPFFIKYKLYDNKRANLLKYGHIFFKTVEQGVFIINYNQNIFFRDYGLDFNEASKFDGTDGYDPDVMFNYSSGFQKSDNKNNNYDYWSISQYTTTLDSTALQNNSLTIPRKFWLNNNWTT